MSITVSSATATTTFSCKKALLHRKIKTNWEGKKNSFETQLKQTLHLFHFKSKQLTNCFCCLLLTAPEAIAWSFITNIHCMYAGEFRQSPFCLKQSIPREGKGWLEWEKLYITLIAVVDYQSNTTPYTPPARPPIHPSIHPSIAIELTLSSVFSWVVGYTSQIIFNTIADLI